MFNLGSSQSLKVSIIGCGNMGGAFVQALEKVHEIDLHVYDSNVECTKAFAKGKNVTVLSKMEDAKGSDIVIIAVKPQILPLIYNDLKSLEPTLFISIAAGVSLEKLRLNLKTDKLVRFMPNIAAKIGHAVTAVAFSSSLEDTERQNAMAIAQSVGTAFELEENLFSAFIGVSGSGIAYALEFMHQMAMGGVREGLPYPKALSIVSDTLLSAATLQKATGKNAIELETMVCSAKGTTIEGITELNNKGFASAIISAVSSAARKSEELEKKA